MTPPLLKKQMAKVKVRPVNAVEIPNKSLGSLIYLSINSILLVTTLD